MSVQNLHERNTTPQKYIFMKAAAARSKGDVVTVDMDAEGYVDLALADNTNILRIAVAYQDILAGDYGLYVVEGETEMTVPSATYVVGNGLQLLDGAVDDTGSAFPATGVNGEAQTPFGVCKVGGVGVTSITAILHGQAFTATT